MQQSIEAKTLLWGVSFIDANTGYAVGGEGTILRTTDGGSTVEHGQPSGTTTWLRDVCFTDANTGTAVGGNWYSEDGGIILRTFDGGLSWISQSIPTSRALNSVFFTDVIMAGLLVITAPFSTQPTAVIQFQ